MIPPNQKAGIKDAGVGQSPGLQMNIYFLAVSFLFTCFPHSWVLLGNVILVSWKVEAGTQRVMVFSETAGSSDLLVLVAKEDLEVEDSVVVASAAAAPVEVGK